MKESIRRRVEKLEEVSRPTSERQRIFFQIVEVDGRKSEILELIAQTDEYVPFLGSEPPGVFFQTVYECRPGVAH